MNFDELDFQSAKINSELVFAGYTGSKNQVLNRLKLQFIELDFFDLIFQKSSTDQQGEYVKHTRAQETAFLTLI